MLTLVPRYRFANAPTVETIEIALTTRENAIALHLPTILMSVEASSE
jgi:hypothetical protein